MPYKCICSSFSHLFLFSIQWTNNLPCRFCLCYWNIHLWSEGCKNKTQITFWNQSKCKKNSGNLYSNRTKILQAVSKYNHSTRMHIIVPEYVFPLSQHIIAHYCTLLFLNMSLVLPCSWICLFSICLGVGCRNVIGISIWETANAALAKPRISSRQICYNKSITMEKGASFQYLQYHEKWISW